MSFSSSSNDYWFFIRWYHHIHTAIHKFISLLVAEPLVFTDDEASRLMKSFLAQQSLLDRLSSFWVEQEPALQLAVILTLTLIAVVVGWVAGLGAILSFATFIASSATHILLLSHHKHRITQARAMVAEIMELLAQLNNAKEHFNQATQSIQELFQQMEHQRQNIAQQTKIIDEQVQTIASQKEEIKDITNQLKTATQRLIETQHQVCEELVEVSTHLEQLDEAVITATDSAHCFHKSANVLTQTVDAIATSQKSYTQAVAQFGLFVAQQRIPKETLGHIDENEFKALQQQLDANDLLIEELKRSGMHL